MKVLKVTDAQVHDAVLHALAHHAPELTGKSWSAVVEMTTDALNALNQANHLEWDKQFVETARIEDAAWRILPLMSEFTHEQVVEKLQSLIKEGVNVKS